MLTHLFQIVSKIDLSVSLGLIIYYRKLRLNIHSVACMCYNITNGDDQGTSGERLLELLLGYYLAQRIPELIPEPLG